MKELKEAYKSYINTKEGLETEILKYFKERLMANKEEINKLIEIRKENITYEEIEKIVEEEIEKETNYKNKKMFIKNEENFMYARLLMPIGVVGIHVFDNKKVIKYILEAVKTHNAIVIIDPKYDELDIKHFILKLMQIVLEKYEIKKELIEILPYEESNDKNYDRVIYTYKGEFEEIEEHELKLKKESETLIIYKEDEYFNEIVKEEESRIKKENNNLIVLEDKEELIKILSEEEIKGVALYTQNGQLAYELINEIRSKNVYINTSLKNIEEMPEYEEEQEELYMWKNIIYPMPQEENEKEEIKNEVEEIKEVSEESETKKENEEDKKLNKEQSLIKVEEKSLISKVKEMIKKILGKR